MFFYIIFIALILNSRLAPTQVNISKNGVCKQNYILPFRQGQIRHRQALQFAIFSEAEWAKFGEQNLESMLNKNVCINLTPISFWNHGEVYRLLKKDSDIDCIGDVIDQCTFKGRMRNSAIYPNHGTRETTTISFLEDEQIFSVSRK